MVGTTILRVWKEQVWQLGKFKVIETRDKKVQLVP